MANSIDISKWSTFINQQGSEWESLHQTSGAAPDLGPAWSLALIAAHQISPDTVSVLSATDDRGLALVFPFRLSRSAAFGIGCQLLDPLLNLHCIHNAILSRLPQQQNETLISNFLADDCDWDILQVNGVVDDSKYAGIWKNLSLRKAPKIITQPATSPPFLSLRGTWAELLASKSSNFRYNLKRKRRQLEKLDSTRFEFINSANDFPRIYEDICTIEKRSWKHAAGTAIAKNPEQDFLYRQLLPELLTRGQLLITLLYFGDRPIAYDISAMSGRLGYCLKTSFDQDFASVSAGVVLRQVLLERLFSTELDEYDFLGADEHYKKQWSSGIRSTSNLTIYRSSWAGKLAASRARLGSMMRRRPAILAQGIRD